MRRLLLSAVFFLCLLPGLAQSAQISLSWRPNPVTEQVTGYRVYHGDHTGMQGFVDAGSPPVQGDRIIYTGDFPEEAICFAAVAYNAETTGLMSDVVCTDNPPSAPRDMFYIRAYNNVTVIH